MFHLMLHLYNMINMIFTIYFKTKDKYILREITPPQGANKTFFKNLLLNIKEQLNIIRKEISSYSDDEKIINLKNPFHPDKEINAKLKKLNKIRNINLIVEANIYNILKEHEFIICSNCGSKMLKMPIGVPFQKIGNDYIFKSIDKVPKYIYSCENCNFTEDEECYNMCQNYKKMRINYLKEGYNWVPNDFGCFYWDKRQKENKKHPDFIETNIKSWRRDIETVKIKNKNVFVKITEICPETGEVKTIK